MTISLRPQLYAKKGGGFVSLLEVTPELWTQALRHRTQILFSVDISAVVMHLGLRPGSVVIETGTGSGSLTASLARAVAPHGHVHSFEFNLERATAARVDFGQLGLSGVVSAEHRDSCGPEGFPSFLDGSVDAVFLDLPQPWVAIPHAKRALRRCGVVCSFSPCIEQVQRTCGELARLGFEDVRTLETLLRPYDLFIAPAPPNRLDMCGEGGGAGEIAGGGAARGVKRQRGPASTESVVAVAAAPGAAEATPLPVGSGPGGVDTTPQCDAPPVQLEAASQHAVVSAAASEPAAASAADSSVGSTDAAAAAAAVAPPVADAAAGSGGNSSVPFPAFLRPVASGSVAGKSSSNARPSATARGHTGYLTFAVLFRKDAEAAASPATSSGVLPVTSSSVL